MLTAGIGASGGVLEDFEARVCLERLAERPCALWTDLVQVEAANKDRIGVSGGADSRDRASGAILELFEARICLERLAERPCALGTDAVALEAVNGGQISVSGGADSRQAMRGGVLERSEGLILL